jgi:hypothetical protein
MVDEHDIPVVGEEETNPARSSSPLPSTAREARSGQLRPAVSVSAGSKIRSSFAVRTAVAATLTRLAVFVVAALGAYLAYRYGESAFRTVGDLFITPWTHKDAGWFVHIAREGYGPGEARTAFFPLYPLLVRAVGVLTLGNDWVAGMLVSLACYAGAMVLLFLLTAARSTKRTAAIAVVLISTFPTAFVFNAVYSESLFLLLTVAVFYLADRRRWFLACLAGSLATLTRSTGIVLVVPLLLLYAEHRGWMPRRGQTARRPAPSWREDARLAWLLLIPAGLGVYMTYLWVRFGDALLFAHVQSSHWRRALNWPWADVWRGARAAYRGMFAMHDRLWMFPSGFLPGHRLEFLFARTLLPFGTLLFAAFCLIIVLRRLPASYGAYSLLALLIPLLEPSGVAPLYSVHRFVLVLFPLFMGLAIVLEKRKKLLWIFVSLSFILMLYLTICFTSGSVAARGVV